MSNEIRVRRDSDGQQLRVDTRDPTACSRIRSFSRCPELTDLEFISVPPCFFGWDTQRTLLEQVVVESLRSRAQLAATQRAALAFSLSVTEINLRESPLPKVPLIADRYRQEPLRLDPIRPTPSMHFRPSIRERFIDIDLPPSASGAWRKDCYFYSTNAHLRCAVNPCGPCEGCQDYKANKQ